MNCKITDEQWQNMLTDLYNRFPSFQKAGAIAYKPGIENIMFFDQMAGHPHKKFKTIHVAGTNGKGSVSNMLASVLSASGLKVGLYTSPHIEDFRERMRIKSADELYYISKDEVWDFVQVWKETFEHLDMSFFEITTMMAFSWFATQKVDIAVIETGLGGRLDTTNIIGPELSIITNIGLDHCDILGNSLAEIAFEKAGIIKPCVPVVVGESDIETDAVFERKTLYTNLSESEFMGDRNRIMSLLNFADKVEPSLWTSSENILRSMDLQGAYQAKNLRTVLAALDVLKSRGVLPASMGDSTIEDALLHTAERMDFHGRWEKVSDNPCIICDIGHNAHGMKYNFSQLGSMLLSGEFTSLIMVYGSVNDKDVRSVLELMPQDAYHIFTQADSHRAMACSELMALYQKVKGSDARCEAYEHISDAVTRALAYAHSEGGKRPLVYVGGSTYVVSEFLHFFKKMS